MPNTRYKRHYWTTGLKNASPLESNVQLANICQKVAIQFIIDRKIFHKTLHSTVKTQQQGQTCVHLYAKSVANISASTTALIKTRAAENIHQVAALLS